MEIKQELKGTKGIFYVEQGSKRLAALECSMADITY